VFWVGIPNPPRRVDPWRIALGIWEFKPRALQNIVDMTASYCLISDALKYVATNGYDKEGMMMEFRAIHLRF
jgi:hypothetical protein